MSEYHSIQLSFNLLRILSNRKEIWMIGGEFETLGKIISRWFIIFYLAEKRWRMNKNEGKKVVKNINNTNNKVRCVE